MANRLWAEVVDASGKTIGIVPLVSATIKRTLDGVGSISITTPEVNYNAHSALQLLRTVRIFWEHQAQGKKLIGTGVLLDQTISVQQGGYSIQWSGNDGLEDLRRINSMRGLAYVDEPIEGIVDDLVSKSSGWSASVEGGLPNTSRRFDATPIIQALITTVTGAGYHFRLSSSKKIEVGSFGGSSGIRMMSASAGTSALDSNSKIALFSTMSLRTSAHEVINWIEPVWGSGDGVLTLRRSDRMSPYTIHEVDGPSGKPIYILKDDDSIAQYGEMQAVLPMLDAPYVSSDNIINAANVLYDWAAKELERRSQPQTSYTVAGVKLDKSLLPGDKIHVIHAGEVYHNGVPIRLVDLDEEFWILGVNETYDKSGQRYSLDISTVDAMIEDATSKLASLMIGETTSRVSQRLTSSVGRYENSGTLDNATPLSVSWITPAEIVDIGRATVIITRDSASGPQNHEVSVDGITIIGGPWLIGEGEGTQVSISVEDILQDGSINGNHTVTVTCEWGSGNTTVAVEIVEIGVSVT